MRAARLGRLRDNPLYSEFHWEVYARGLRSRRRETRERHHESREKVSHGLILPRRHV